jgi:hypothetical protein
MYIKTLLFFSLLSLFLIIPAFAQEDSSAKTQAGFIAVDMPASSTEVMEENVELTAAEDLSQGPVIRVGLYKIKTAIKFVSDFEYDLFVNGKPFGFLPAGEIATLSFKDGKYFFKSGSFSTESDTYFRLEPKDSASYFSLPSCPRKLNKKSYCDYRGILEYRYGALSKMPYIINELPIEQYVRGISEASNTSAYEFIKALSVAARTYAFVRISGEEPTGKSLFDVFANTNDQLYLGRVSELEKPRVVQATEETNGELVLFGGAPVTTPYFSRSDGKTKTRLNKYGENYMPWLGGVECEYDKGKKLWGHGYGMSLNDASKKARNDGWNMYELLGYYYNGTEVSKMY